MAKIHCPFCDFSCYKSEDFSSHIEKEHNDMIPPDYTPARFAYYLRTGKKSGKCVVCGAPTKWNTKTNKYNRFCEKKECKDKYREMFKKRMIHKYGKTTLLNDPEMQRKMLANRKISGVYIWSDYKHKFTYTGSYELSFLEFMDKILNFDPEDIMAPSPHNYIYKYENEDHFYIPDFFIPSLELEVEIKDGGDNKNMHPKIVAVDKVKERLKDDVMKNNHYNYIKIVNKENKKFLLYLEKAKENAFNNKKEKIIMI